MCGHLTLWAKARWHGMGSVWQRQFFTAWSTGSRENGSVWEPGPTFKIATHPPARTSLPQFPKTSKIMNALLWETQPSTHEPFWYINHYTDAGSSDFRVLADAGSGGSPFLVCIFLFSHGSERKPMSLASPLVIWLCGVRLKAVIKCLPHPFSTSLF